MGYLFFRDISVYDSDEEAKPPEKTFEQAIFGRRYVASTGSPYDSDADSWSSDNDWSADNKLIPHRPIREEKTEQSGAEDRSFRTIRPQPVSASWLMSNSCANRIGKLGMAVFFLGLAMLAMATSGTTLFYLGTVGVGLGLGLGFFAKCCAKPEQERKPLSFVHHA